MTREVQQDIPIWEHKRYVDSPALASSEKPIADWRRWFSQFYVETAAGASASGPVPSVGLT